MERRGLQGTCRVQLQLSRHLQPVLLLGSNDFTIPKYWLANANLSLSPASGGPWTVTLWGRNIFDKAYDVTRNFFLPSAEVAEAGEPTTVGIRVSYKY
jgi:iron complex outermembrane receptor protein